MAIFRKIAKSYTGWIRKNLGINPTYFCDFPSKIENLGSKLKF